MKEADYITATNLVKVKMAQSIVRDLFPDKCVLSTEQIEVLKILNRWEGKLYGEVGK